MYEKVHQPVAFPMHMHTYEYQHKCTSTHIYTCMYEHMHTHTCINTNAWPGIEKIEHTSLGSLQELQRGFLHAGVNQHVQTYFDTPVFQISVGALPASQTCGALPASQNLCLHMLRHTNVKPMGTWYKDMHARAHKCVYQDAICRIIFSYVHV